MSDPKATKDDTSPEADELNADELEQVNGGTALMLPAVQAGIAAGDGSVRIADSSVDGADFLTWQRNFGANAARKK
jgi:hypothetical protein